MTYGLPAPRRLLRLVLAFASSAAAFGADAARIDRGPVVDPTAAEWRELAKRYAEAPDAVAPFEERRVFPFRKEPLVLKGHVRVARRHGLSLQYTSPEPRIVILDERGVLVREAGSEKTPPADPRAQAANEAMFHVLRLDLGALEKAFEIFGARAKGEWTLTLHPRAEAVRRSLGDIFVTGDDVSVRRIEIRKSPKQYIAIAIDPPRSSPAFSRDELKSYFR